VADLLECLIQVKGVADTPRRLAIRTADVCANASSLADAERRVREVAVQLAAAEVVYRDCLSLMLALERPAIPALPGARATRAAELSAEEARAVFAARRTDTVQVLDRCSAEQLNRIGIEPARGPMTVADLVALMLAHDTDALGALALP
jgi:hypothetical protein